MNREFLIPAMSGLALTTTACSGDGVFLGDWVGATLIYDGATYQLPLEYEYGDDVDRLNWLLTNRDDGTTVITYRIEYVEDGATSTYDYPSGGTWERIERREYRIELNDDEVALDCSADSDSLTCAVEAPGDSDQAFVFVR
ncbi:MAG: hypothetical protein EA397_15685 [Deltaproteobacteria bacterium]|nr:MAG: hypothetical protein EA397_15685 [Deltaproteobacteria bacterium]